MTDLRLTGILGAAAAAVASVAEGVGAPPEVLGAPVGVLLAACAGALFGLAYTPPERWGQLLALPEGPPARRAWAAFLRGAGVTFTLAANAFAVTWFVAIFPHLPGMDWAKGAPMAPPAGLLAFAGQHVIPTALLAAREWIHSKRKGKSP